MTGRPIKAAITYVALIFALGFALGTLRVLWLVPLVGEHRAVLAELPIMLAASFFAAKWLTRRFGIASHSSAALMGGLAFILLMLAEALLVAPLFGTSITAWLASLLTPPELYGLAGQIAFGLMPVLVWHKA